MSTTAQTDTHTLALHHAEAVADQANDLAGFLSARPALSPELEAEAAFLLSGIRTQLEGLANRIANAGPR